MLISSTTTQYLQRVPIQVGSCIINQVTSCISEEELQFLSQSWKMAYVSTIISKATSVSDSKFNLDHVRGRVVISEEVTIAASQTTVVKGLTMITGHHKCVHVLMESSHKCRMYSCNKDILKNRTIIFSVETSFHQFCWQKVVSTEKIIVLFLRISLLHEIKQNEKYPYAY